MFNIDTEFNRGEDYTQTVDDISNSPARKRLNVVQAIIRQIARWGQRCG